MKRTILIGIIVILLIGSGVSAFLLIGPSDSNNTENPDEVVDITPSPTASPTDTPTHTATPSPTVTPSITPSPTATATLAIRVVETDIIMPDVTLPPISTPLPDNLQILAEPPEPVEPLPNATLIPFPYTDFTDWVAFESDHPAMQYVAGEWTPIGSLQASQGQYHYAEDTGAVMSFTFTGEAVRVRYVGFTNGGVWNVLIDDMLADVIDSYAPIGTFTGTDVYYVGEGEHTLELRNTDTTNDASSGNMLAIDAVQVYRPDPLTLILCSGVLPSATPTPIIPTPTPLPARGLLYVELTRAATSPNGYLVTELRLYNGQFEPVTIYPDDIRIAFGNRPNPPGPWQPAEGFDELTILPGQALDLSITWEWDEEPFGAVEVLNYRFATLLR